LKKVSVIIPVYNVEKYLGQCIDSVIQQTLPDIEIICVNDGSTDGSSEILENYAKKDTRIRIINKENGGLSSARNAGLDTAEGEYVYFLDSDDYIVKDAMEKCYAKAKSEDLDLVRFEAESFFETEELLKDYSQYESYYQYNGEYESIFSGDELFSEMVLNKDYKESVCIQFIKLSVIETHHLRFFEGIVHEDNPFSLFLMFRCARACVIKEKLFIRRVREGSIMSVRNEIESVTGYIVGISLILDTFKGERHSTEIAAALRRYISKRIEVISKIYIALTEEDQKAICERLDTTQQVILQIGVVQPYTNLCKAEKTAARLATKASKERYENSKQYKIGRVVCRILPKKMRSF
jgi:glycosyltransferase involved in cell wall biosynthesis